LEQASVQRLLDAVRERLPEGPFLYDPEHLTAQTQRELGCDLIREACIECLREEVPHALAVVIDSWRESDGPVRVEATVHVERASQKRIVVGKGGTMVARIRARAQAKLTDLCGTPARVRLWVKVSRDWRDSTAHLREFGQLQ
jgi:GTP-binding protein Era